jgi:hypothetical protein
MKILFLLLAAVVLSTGAMAQTKRLAHRSHSGSHSDFNLSGNANWGVPVPEKKKSKKHKAVVTKKTTRVPLHRHRRIKHKANS